MLTQALLRVLRGEELIGDGEVTISQIDDWLKQQFADQATQKPYLLIEGDYRLTLADHRVRLEAQRTAAERQRRRDEALALIARWCSRDSLARAAELQTGFVGRVQELEDIRQHIAQLRPDGGYLLVTGVAGQGKSSILAQLLKDADPPIPAYFIRFTPGPAEQAALLGHLVAELLLQNGLEEEASTYLSDAANAITLRNSLVSLMERLSQERQLTLVIDGLDQIPVDYGIGQRDLSFLPERLPEGVVVVIGTRPDDTLVPLTLLTPCREYQLPPLSPNDFAALLAQRGVTLSEGDRQALHA
ncbi:MAG: ATP-binding protein, partial [Chloroflexus sp.]|nr:ATP-binding protein [Chloroflexus sp.]